MSETTQEAGTHFLYPRRTWTLSPGRSADVRHAGQGWWAGPGLPGPGPVGGWVQLGAGAGGGGLAGAAGASQSWRPNEDVPMVGQLPAPCPIHRASSPRRRRQGPSVVRPLAGVCREVHLAFCGPLDRGAEAGTALDPCQACTPGPGPHGPSERNRDSCLRSWERLDSSLDPCPHLLAQPGTLAPQCWHSHLAAGHLTASLSTCGLLSGEGTGLALGSDSLGSNPHSASHRWGASGSPHKVPLPTEGQGTCP